MLYRDVRLGGCQALAGDCNTSYSPPTPARSRFRTEAFHLSTQLLAVELLVRAVESSFHRDRFSVLYTQGMRNRCSLSGAGLIEPTSVQALTPR